MAEKEGKSARTKAEKPKSTADMLLENFISLQRIMADLAVKTARLNNQLSRLLELFEEAAKNFKEGKGAGHQGKERSITGPNEELASKMDRLIEQNKTIARGLSSIVEKRLSGGEAATIEEESGKEEKVKAKPLPEFRF